jgi:hypothetical protein
MIKYTEVKTGVTRTIGEGKIKSIVMRDPPWKRLT